MNILGIITRHEEAIAVYFTIDELLLILPKEGETLTEVIEFENNNPSFVAISTIDLPGEVLCAAYEIWQGKKILHQKELDDGIIFIREQFALSMNK